MSNRKKRVFTIVDYPDIGKTTGRYSGLFPKQAADKVIMYLTKIADIKNTSDQNFIICTIRDINNNKEYKYIGTRVELDKPIVVNNRKIRYRPIVARYPLYSNK